MKKASRTIKLTLAYDGTEFAGWQIQPQRRTVQEILEKALHQLTTQPTRIVGAGRTDAGVHAEAQVAHFITKSHLKMEVFSKGLNALLPEDVAVIKAEEAVSGFHSRFSAKRKVYRYTVWTETVRHPLYRKYSYHYSYPLSFNTMKRGAELFLGIHDFASFASNRGRPEKSTVRQIFSFEVKKKNSFLVFQVEANGFLYKMMRGIVGTMLEIGRNKLTIEDFKQILDKKDRKYGGPNLPPQGLCLEKVIY